MAKKIAFNTKQSGLVRSYIIKYKTLAVFLGLLLVVVGIRIGISVNSKHKQQQKEAVEALSAAQYLIEKKQYDKALQGEKGVYPGLEQLSKQVIDNDARNLVNLYLAIIYIKREKYEKALKHLKLIGMSDLFMQARARSLAGDVHCELGNYDQAIACYLEAAKYKRNEFFTPTYFIKASQVYEKQKKYDKAIHYYQIIIDTYPACRQNTYVKKQLAKLEVLKSKA